MRFCDRCSCAGSEVRCWCCAGKTREASFSDVKLASFHRYDPLKDHYMRGGVPIPIEEPEPASIV